MTVCQAAHEARFGYKNKHFPCWTRGVKPGSAYYEDPRFNSVNRLPRTAPDGDCASTGSARRS